MTASGGVRRLLGACGALSLLAGSALVAVSAPALAATTPRTVTVSRTDGLGTQVVRVSWAGFTPTRRTGQYAVNVVQCVAGATSIERDCFNAAPFPNSENGNGVIGASTRADGTGSVDLEVRDATSLPALACSAAKACSIVAYELTGRALPTDRLPDEAAIAPITFAPGVADCPARSRFDVTAEGEASGADLVYGWAARRCTGASPQAIDFTETSSNEGRRSLLGGHVDLAVTSAPATDAERTDAGFTGRLAYAPLDLTGVAVVFNMRDPITGQRITDLTLSPRLVARIISASDLFGVLRDPELAALNPGVHFPTNSLSPPLLRSELNADTGVTTAWLAADRDAAAFLAGNDRYGVPVNRFWKDVAYPTDVFENREGTTTYIPRHGRMEVVERVFRGVTPTGNSATSPDYIGFVGVVDLPTAQRFGLPVAKLVNAAGRAVAPTPESLLAGFAGMTRDADGTRRANPATTDPAAYPLVKIDYAATPATPTSAERGAAIASFLRYAAGDGQSAVPAGYVALPAALVDETRAIATGLAGDVAAPTALDIPVAPSIDLSGGASFVDVATDPSAGVGPIVAPIAPKDAGFRRYTPIAAYGAGRRAPLAIVLGVGLALLAVGAAGLTVSALRRRAGSGSSIGHLTPSSGRPAGVAA